ncbi:MAG: TetR/AcrR family transcriptional regulator [Microthrixaceae bacterium]
MAAPSSSRRTQTERRADAEAKLLASAAELIAEQGVGRTSLAQIGTRAGFSRGIVNHHFGTKARLVEELVRHSQREFASALPASDHLTGLDALVAFADKYLRILHRSDPRSQAFLIIWSEAAGAGRDLRATIAKRDRRTIDALEAMIRRGIDDGSIRADAHPTAVAVSLLAELRGLGLEATIAPELCSLSSLREPIVARVRAGLETG